MSEIDQKRARAIVEEALSQQQGTSVGAIIDGWPTGVYQVREEGVWSVRISEPPISVGGDRVIVVSKTTGAILADTRVGE